MTTVTNNSPQAINTSLFSMEKDTNDKAKLLNEKLNEVNSAIAEINKILDGINKDAGVVSVNGKQGIVTLDASDIEGFAEVATSGNYNDLTNKPSIPAAQVNSDWNATSGVARILNKPSLASVATSGSYNDLSNKPTIPSKTSQLTNDSGFVSPQNVLFNDADIPEGSGNLADDANVHKITTFRNGLMIPYQMDNPNDGGLLRVRGTSENNCVLELGTWDDSGSGETIQFNYYPTTSKDTPTHSVSVPKKSGTIALTSDVPTKTSQLTNDSDFATNGAITNAINANNTNFKSFNKQYYTLDLTNLDINTFYPVTFESTDLEHDCEIHSPNVSGGSAYNQNRIHFLLTTQGWSDTGTSYTEISYYKYDVGEVTIGSIARGEHGGTTAVFLRGGMIYRMISNLYPTLRTTTTTIAGDETYEPGPNFYGGTNVNVQVLKIANTTSNTW